ncbi:hypothetical protein HPHPP8B_0313 [Helicobacter pylori Hp P-8b]|nr:hypothetical protein HPHPP8_0312 [Helicobacter pylori Hp P-8]EJC27761.1 hypothetical protein HPHPP8B_0313 [Helicobacter pylori Hp P-8b]
MQPLVNFLRGFYQATLKGWWLNQLFKTNSFNTALFSLVSPIAW